MLKKSFEVADRVEYLARLAWPLKSKARVSAQILKVSTGVFGTWYRIEISTGLYTKPIKLWTKADCLISIIQIPDPNRIKYLKEKAEIVAEATVDYFFDDDSEEYFESAWELVQKYVEDGYSIEEIPDYAFGTRREYPTIADADQQLENAITNLELRGDYEEGYVFKISDFSGVTELQEAITKFNLQNTDCYVVKPDYTKIIYFNKEELFKDVCD